MNYLNKKLFKFNQQTSSSSSLGSNISEQPSAQMPSSSSTAQSTTNQITTSPPPPLLPIQTSNASMSKQLITLVDNNKGIDESKPTSLPLATVLPPLSQTNQSSTNKNQISSMSSGNLNNNAPHSHHNFYLPTSSTTNNSNWKHSSSVTPPLRPYSPESNSIRAKLNGAKALIDSESSLNRIDLELPLLSNNSNSSGSFGLSRPNQLGLPSKIGAVDILPSGSRLRRNDLECAFELNSQTYSSFNVYIFSFKFK